MSNNRNTAALLIAVEAAMFHMEDNHGVEPEQNNHLLTIANAKYNELLSTGKLDIRGTVIEFSTDEFTSAEAIFDDVDAAVNAANQGYPNA